ncbi:MAG: hypothetical protein MR469_07765 [Campylobacter sp.]|uniref:hypothetical protein n=1 Tax=Campylobacter sp. TaxID=205 RepID=UPI002AA6656C|nr:hypothetical protein [Campylobacter sp.]MCI6695517.1 hypothetical protein [Campylobacter sp.]
MGLSDLLNKNAGTTSIASIVSIDVAKSLAYCFEENSLKVLSLQKANKDATNIVSVKLKDIQNTHVQSILNGEDLQKDIVVQTRKNLSLDDEAEYIVKSRMIGENSYESYALNYEVLSEGLQDVLLELRYIDKIIPDPFLFEGLYEAKVLNANETHCFLFLDDDDAFLALYNNGKFGFTRGFSMYSLTNLCEQYKNNAGADIELRDFLNLLKNEGVNGAFFSVLDDMAFYISDIFNSIASQANADISKVFIGSSIGAIPGLANLINQKLYIETIDFDFNKKFEAGDLDPSCMNAIRYYYAKYILDDSLNFTAFYRPPAFLKRDGGQFLVVVAIACVLGLITPIYELGSALYYFGINSFEESKLEDIKKELAKLEPVYESIKGQVDNQNKQINELEVSIATSKRLLDESEDKKFNYRSKAEFLSDIGALISDVKVKSTHINFKNNEANIHIISDDDNKITALIEKIDKSSKFRVTTERISAQNTNSALFESNITVGFIK